VGSSGVGARRTCGTPFCVRTRSIAQDYYVDQATLELLGESAAHAGLLTFLRNVLGDREERISIFDC
jgi:hypothetical protein